MKKRLFATLLALVMALGLTATAWADDPVTGVSYVDEKGEEQLYTGNYTEITNEDKSDEWITGWYVVRGNVEINYNEIATGDLSTIVAVTGNAHLILCDGAKLTVRMDQDPLDIRGILVNKSSSLTIYGQAHGTGLLSVTSNRNEGGIDNFGTLTINGGTVTANSTENSDGIYNNGTLTINNGTVTANGAGGGDGINNYQGTLTINGGVVTANGDSTGDGSGIKSNGGNVVITGGTVKATGVVNKYGQAVRIINDATLTLPTTTYWWRTEKNGDFTASTTAAYDPSKVAYAELTTTQPDGWVDPSVSYVGEKGVTQTSAAPTPITSSTTTLNNGDYVVKEDVTIDSDLTIPEGTDVKLILMDGKTLTVNSKIRVGGNSTTNLTIYGQSGQTGTLICKGAMDIVPSNSGASSSVTLNGGTVDVGGGMAIQCGSTGKGSHLTVNGGKLSVTNSGGDAIRVEGYGSANGAMTINGGTVIAKSTKDGGRAINRDNINNDTKLGTLELPTTYWWRTAENGTFTKYVDENTAYTPGSEAYAEITTTQPVQPAPEPEPTQPTRPSGNKGTTTTETVTSPKTTDPGVLLTGALSVVSLLGMGYVSKKR